MQYKSCNQGEQRCYPNLFRFSFIGVCCPQSTGLTVTTTTRRPTTTKRPAARSKFSPHFSALSCIFMVAFREQDAGPTIKRPSELSVGNRLILANIRGWPHCCLKRMNKCVAAFWSRPSSFFQQLITVQFPSIGSSSFFFISDRPLSDFRTVHFDSSSPTFSRLDRPV